MKKVILPLVYRDKVNKNGWRIPLCVFKKSFEDERIKEMLKTNSFFIKDSKEYGKTRETDINNSLGKIISFDLDNLTAEVSLFDDDFDIVNKGIFLEFLSPKDKRFTINNIIIITSCLLTGATILDIEKSSYLESPK